MNLPSHFFFLLFWFDEFHCLWVCWCFFFSGWFSLLFKSYIKIFTWVIIFFNSLISVWYFSKCSLCQNSLFSYIILLTLSIFMTIILCSLLGKSLISFSLIWFIAISFVLVFGTYSPISSFPLTLFVDICTLNKKPAYFILIDWSHKETNLISQPGLSTWLSFKCLCLCCHCFPSGSQFLRV